MIAGYFPGRTAIAVRRKFEKIWDTHFAYDGSLNEDGKKFFS